MILNTHRTRQPIPTKIHGRPIPHTGTLKKMTKSRAPYNLPSERGSKTLQKSTRTSQPGTGSKKDTHKKCDYAGTGIALCENEVSIWAAFLAPLFCLGFLKEKKLSCLCEGRWRQSGGEWLAYGFECRFEMVWVIENWVVCYGYNQV